LLMAAQLSRHPLCFKDKMKEIPEWNEAIKRFQSFLESEGCSSNSHWVFRDDICKRKPEELLVRWPLSDSNIGLVEKVFNEGKMKGLVAIDAIGKFANGTIATVWFPKLPGEEVQGWNQNVKLTISIPMPEASLLSSLFWKVLTFSPGYRRYQRYAEFIGTSDWAKA